MFQNLSLSFSFYEAKLLNNKDKRICFLLNFRKRTHQNTSIAIFLSDKIVTLHY